MNSETIDDVLAKIKDTSGKVTKQVVLENFDNLNNIEKIAVINAFYSIDNSAKMLNVMVDFPNKCDFLLIYICLVFGYSPKELFDLVKVSKKLYVSSSIMLEFNSFGLQQDYLLKGYDSATLFSKLGDYLSSNKDDPKFKDRINKLYNEVLNSFVDNFKFFELPGFRLDPFKFVTSEFLYNNNVDYLNNMFTNLMSKNSYFDRYDYKSAFSNGFWLASKIKGLYRKISNDSIEDICFSSFKKLNSKERKVKTVELIGQFDSIYELNKDDEEGLYVFFSMVSKYKSIFVNKELYHLLESRDYYRKYSAKNTINKIYDNIINEIKEGSIGHHTFEIMVGLGLSDKFDNLDYLKLFMESNDEEFKKSLIISIICANFQKMKKSKNLSVSIEFTTISNKRSTIGYYSAERDILFVDKNYILNCGNPLECLIKFENTLFHEVTHAEQRQMIKNKPQFNSLNLLMSIEYLLMDIDDDYYKENYSDISFERDARAQAYVHTMIYFDKYPKAKKIIEKQYAETVDNMRNYIKLNKVFPLEDGYSNLFKLLIGNFFAAEDEDDLKFNKEYYLKYPLIKMVFDFDEKTGVLSLKPDSYFRELRLKYIQMPDSVQKRKALECLDMIDYEKNVMKFFKDKASELNGFESDNIEIGRQISSYEELEKIVENECGKAPEVKR